MVVWSTIFPKILATASASSLAPTADGWPLQSRTGWELLETQTWTVKKRFGRRSRHGGVFPGFRELRLRDSGRRDRLGRSVVGHRARADRGPRRRQGSSGGLQPRWDPIDRPLDGPASDPRMGPPRSSERLAELDLNWRPSPTGRTGRAAPGLWVLLLLIALIAAGWMNGRSGTARASRMPLPPTRR